jgi:hypothetical protein
MKLQTQIPLQPEQNQIDYSSRILLMGSCFTENIGDKFAYFKFDRLQNPFGIVFHPLAIEKLVSRAVNNEVFTQGDIFYYNEQWHCFDVHSRLSASEKDAFLKLLNEELDRLREYLVSASHIVFTYGTAWVYRFNETKSVVANCHKIPQQKFTKELLSIEEITTGIENTIAGIRKGNPKAEIIFTVSPVRHIKDGIVENSRSKAHLIAGLHKVIDANKSVHYFPAYEIVMDELRDYRFYEEDLLHPNNTAVSIIWEKFKQVWISSNTEPIQKEIAVIQSGLAHRPFNSQSEAHGLFQKELQQKIKAVQKKIPRLKF